MAAERPANHGQSSHGLRGDYGRMRPDYTVDQDSGGLRRAEHDRWRRLYRRQIELVAGRACGEYVAALRSLPYEQGVPRFDEVNAALGAATALADRGGSRARARRWCSSSTSRTAASR